VCPSISLKLLLQKLDPISQVPIKLLLEKSESSNSQLSKRAELKLHSVKFTLSAFTNSKDAPMKEDLEKLQEVIPEDENNALLKLEDRKLALLRSEASPKSAEL